MQVLLIIIGLTLFVALVVVHEFGHFIAARRNQVVVDEFGIGFPPKIWGKKLKSKMLFTINALPLGGFVRLRGEHDADTEEGSYGAASLWAKTKIIGAGIVMNLMVAVIIFTIIALIGMPKIVDNQFTVASDTKVLRNEVLIGVIEPDSPASHAGLKQRDQLLSLGVEDAKRQVTTADDLPSITREFAGKTVEVEYKRDGSVATTEAKLLTTEDVDASRKTENPKGYLGISPAEYTLQRSTWSAPIVGLGVAKQFTELTYRGLGSVVAQLFKGDTSHAADQVSGPVGIFVLIKDGSSLGLQFVLMIIGVISLTLGLINLLPIPALDGGRLFVTYLYRAMGKKLTPEAEERIHGTGFAILMLLFVVITVVDVRRFIL